MRRPRMVLVVWFAAKGSAAPGRNGIEVKLGHVNEPYKLQPPLAASSLPIPCQDRGSTKNSRHKCNQPYFNPSDTHLSYTKPTWTSAHTCSLLDAADASTLPVRQATLPPTPSIGVADARARYPQPSTIGPHVLAALPIAFLTSASNIQ